MKVEKLAKNGQMVQNSQPLSPGVGNSERISFKTESGRLTRPNLYSSDGFDKFHEVSLVQLTCHILALLAYCSIQGSTKQIDVNK